MLTLIAKVAASDAQEDAEKESIAADDESAHDKRTMGSE